MKMHRQLNGVNRKGRIAMMFDLAARRRIARITNIIFAGEAAKGNKYVYRLGGMDISELEQMQVNSCRMYNFNDLVDRLKVPAPGNAVEDKLNKKVIVFKFDFDASGVEEVTKAIQDCKDLNDLCEKRHLPARGLAAAFMHNFGMVKAIYMPSKVAEIPYSFLLVNKTLTKKDLMHELIHVIQEFTGLSIAPDFTDSFKKRNVDDGYGGLLFNQSEIIPYFNSIMYEFDEKLIEPKKMTVDELWKSIEEYRKRCVSKSRSDKSKPTKSVIDEIVSNPSDDMQKSLSTPDRHVLAICFVHGQYVSMFGKMFDNYFKDKDIDDDIKNDEDDGDESWYVKSDERKSDERSNYRSQGREDRMVSNESLKNCLELLIEQGRIDDDDAKDIVRQVLRIPERMRTVDKVKELIEEFLENGDAIKKRREEEKRKEDEYQKKVSIEYAVDTDDLKRRIDYYKEKDWYNLSAKDKVEEWLDRKIEENEGNDKECERLRNLKKQYLG